MYLIHTVINHIHFTPHSLLFHNVALFVIPGFTHFYEIVHCVYTCTNTFVDTAKYGVMSTLNLYNPLYNSNLTQWNFRYIKYWPHCPFLITFCKQNFLQYNIWRDLDSPNQKLFCFDERTNRLPPEGDKFLSQSSKNKSTSVTWLP